MSYWNYINIGASTRAENKKLIEKIFEYMGYLRRPRYTDYEECHFARPDVYGLYYDEKDPKCSEFEKRFDSIGPTDLLHILNALFPKTNVYVQASEGNDTSDTWENHSEIYDTNNMTYSNYDSYTDYGGYGPNGKRSWKKRFALKPPILEHILALIEYSKADGNSELTIKLQELAQKLENGLLVYEDDDSDQRVIGKKYDVIEEGDIDDDDEDDDEEDEDEEDEEADDDEDEEEENDKSKYAIRNGTLTRYKGHAKRIVIPDGVVEIVDGAFEYCGLKSVKMPDSVKAVDDGAFRDYEGMDQMWLPLHPEYIGSESFNLEIKEMHYPGDFESWLALDKSEWPDSPLVVADEFYCNGKRITEYSIPEGTEHIEDEAFQECHILEKITIPNSVTSIGKYAFAYIGSLKEITIPNSVKEIGEGAFYCCENLEKAVIPKELKEMVQANDVFGDCESLTDIQYI